MKSLNKNVLALAVAAVVSGQVAAYEAGDIIGRVGYAAVDPRESSTDLKLDGDPAPLAGVNVGVDGAASLGLTATYMLTSHVGVELLAATPFSHEVYLNEANLRLGSVKHLPPTLTLQYYPLDASSKFQPYAGVGVNYTTFFNESVSSQAKSALNASDLSLKDSYGLAGELGLDYRLDDHWLVNAAVWYIQIESDASVNVDLGAGKQKVKGTVTLDPWVYMFSIGYKF